VHCEQVKSLVSGEVVSVSARRRGQGGGATIWRLRLCSRGDDRPRSTDNRPAQLTTIGWVSEHSKSGKPLLSLVADDAAAAGDEVEDGAAPGTAADAPADVW
jgi:hypothetical protein